MEAAEAKPKFFKFHVTLDDRTWVTVRQDQVINKIEGGRGNGETAL